MLEILSNQLVTVKAGEAATIRVPFKGKPVPKVSWYRDGVELVEESRTMVERNGASSTLILSKCVREDSGTVTLKLKSDFGSASTTMQLNVIGENMAKILALHAQYYNAYFLECTLWLSFVETTNQINKFYTCPSLALQTVLNPLRVQWILQSLAANV